MIVTLYGKPDCPLCDEALAHLEALAAEFGFAIEKVDITRDERLFRRFRRTIPVIDVAGVTLYAPIDPQDLRQAVRAALG